MFDNIENKKNWTIKGNEWIINSLSLSEQTNLDWFNTWKDRSHKEKDSHLIKVTDFSVL